MKVTLEITGTRPMLQHNGRLSNPIDPYTRRLKTLTGKRRKTDEDLIEIMQVEARGACWETEDGRLGVPTAAVWRTIYDAAKAYKRGEDIKRALILEDTVEPLVLDGETVMCDEFLTDPSHIDYRPVKVNGRKTMRARPLVPLPWSVRVWFELLEDVVDSRDLTPILQRAGRLHGLGDWHPVYGTYEVEVIE